MLFFILMFRFRGPGGMSGAMNGTITIATRTIEAGFAGVNMARRLNARIMDYPQDGPRKLPKYLT